MRAVLRHFGKVHRLAEDGASVARRSLAPIVDS
jgi:hypothetical protein